MMASFHYVLENGIEGTDKVALKQKLKEAIAQADQSKHSSSDIIQKASDAVAARLNLPCSSRDEEAFSSSSVFFR